MSEPILKNVLISSIEASDLQVRSTLGDLTELASSIKELGLQEPVLVKDVGNGAYALFAGNRRFEASKMAEKKDIRALVYDRDTSTKLMYTLNFVENFQREDLNPIDEARGFERLKSAFGLSDDEIRVQVGVSKKVLRERKRLLEMSDLIQEAVLQDRIPLRAAFEIDRLPKDLQGKFVTMAEELKGERIAKLVDKALKKIEAKSENKPDPAPDPEKSAITELVRTARKAGQIMCNGLGYEDEKKQRVKEVNLRLLEFDDLKIITQLFDDCADRVPDGISFNKKAEEEIVSVVETSKGLDVESPVVRQALIKSIVERCEEVAIEKSEESGKRPKVTYAIAKAAIEEFYK